VDVSVISSGHHVADARLHRHCAALRRAGLRVEVLARGAAADAPAGVVFRPLPDGGRAWRGLTALGLPAAARGRVLLTLDPDVVPSARLWRRGRPETHGRRLVVDVHEDYLALLGDRHWARGAAGAAARGLARTATVLSRGADLTVVADEQVPPGVARRRLVVRNLPDLLMLPEPAPPEPSPRALYIGDVRSSRGLFTMLEAVARAPGWRLDVVGPQHAAERADLDQWRAGAPEAARRVRFHGRLPPERAWRLAAGAWVGLALLEPTAAFRRALPSKIYEYLACGLPVLTSDLPRPAALIGGAGAGAVVGGAAEAAAVLRDWSGPGRGGQVRCRAAALAWAVRVRGEECPYDALAREVALLADGRYSAGSADTTGTPGTARPAHSRRARI
jgi:glycosyltransferase involved in cell wall biosynthesis